MLAEKFILLLETMVQIQWTYPSRRQPLGGKHVSARSHEAA